ncbi:DNA (cytosine-5-)-methyltransferase [Peptostreptococcus faecalis]|uniref:DNA (cytosine-5-)-methyltransferase n=1 Tax=Peptostreptococcus faecalis TaxID=2045015 RepID=UPI000C7BA0F7|nr:DNA (cytosine-5-)-methyltransferase [Peptostreptococcus faecalis]
MKLTVAELFAGVGGFRVGLNHISEIDLENRAIEKGDWEFVWANQYEPSTKAQHAFNCYTTRFGLENHSNEDINKVNKDEIPDHSLLVGGFPCQDYSVARSLSNEQGIEGKKGVLFWDIKEVLVAKKSPFVLLENVDRLLKSPASRRGRDFAVMLKTFDELGYYVQWRVINAGEYAMPQKRRRVFIFAHKKNLNYSWKIQGQKLDINRDNIFNDIFPIEKALEIESLDLNEYKDVLDVSNNFKEGKFLETGMMVDGNVIHARVSAKVEPIFSLEKILSISRKYNADVEEYAIEKEKLNKWEYLKGSKRIERTSSNGHSYIYSEGSMAFPEKIEEPARTMLTSEGTLNRSSHIVFDREMKKLRKLTPVECELIQMFPPNWTDTMPKRNRYFMMGNALVTGIIARIEPKLKKIIESE